MLPIAFLERMQRLLGAEFPAFQVALEQSRTNAIRVNELMLQPSALEALLGLTLTPVPWSRAGFYVPYESRLGSHPLHHAGAYYVQEASAQAVAAVLEPQPGERVLDLCAAPGGKSTHLAALMRNQGVLVSNDLVAARARVLQENLERLGCIGVVSNESPARLAAVWGAYFDRVLVDAPCSGEGMFRKHPEAARDWSEGAVLACEKRQSEILKAAAALLKPSGVLVYSTCTFAPEENEAVIERFLETHPNFALEPIPGFRAGLNGVGVRLWPHQLRGEGHFMARLRKLEGDDTAAAPEGQSGFSPFARGHGLAKAWLEFGRRFGLPESAQFAVFRDTVQGLEPGAPPLNGLKVLRAGVPVAQLHQDRLEPHHALAHLQNESVYANAAPAALDLEFNDPRVAAYLRGESLESQGEPGWLRVRVAGLALGWGKRVGRVVKNHYPKHLRGQTRQLEE